MSAVTVERGAKTAVGRLRGHDEGGGRVAGVRFTPRPAVTCGEALRVLRRVGLDAHHPKVHDLQGDKRRR